LGEIQDPRSRDVMSDTGATREGTRATPATSRGRAANFALRVPQALLALMFAMAGFAKVGGDPAMVEMFATIGVGQWFRYVVGALEISGAVGVLVPRLSGPAALGLVCLMVGAIFTHQPVRPRREPVASTGLAGGERSGRPGPTGAVRGAPRPFLALSVLGGTSRTRWDRSRDKRRESQPRTATRTVERGSRYG
jgi:putative oxidoreductase